jgi:hypothetical protein
MSIFTSIGAFLKKVFVDITQDADKVAITLTEGVKTALVNGTLGFIANILDTLTKSGIPTEVVNLVSANIDKVLAVELAIQGLPANPTAADVLAFEQSVLAAFGVTSDKSKLYTVLAAQIYGIIQVQVNNATAVTFAQLVADVEQAYADYVQDQTTTN